MNNRPPIIVTADPVNDVHNVRNIHVGRMQLCLTQREEDELFELLTQARSEATSERPVFPFV